MPRPPAKNRDPRGVLLLKRRLTQCSPLLRQFLETPLQVSRKTAAKIGSDFIIAGLGSSHSHAAYLKYLLELNPRFRAEVINLSARSLPRKSLRKKTLVVFSQGLSPHALQILKKRSRFRHVVLFTAATIAAQKHAHTERARLLAALEKSGATLVHFPLENEYTTLLRVVGPVFGYLAAYRFAAALVPGLPPLPRRRLRAVFRSAQTQAKKLRLEQSRRGISLVVSSPLFQFAQNLRYKFVEGSFAPSTQLAEPYDFAHGPFQFGVAHKLPALCLGVAAPVRNRIRRVQQAARLEFRCFNSKLPAALAIVEYEMLLNWLVWAQIKNSSVQQIRWPGKGLDAPLYFLDAR